MIRSWKHKGLKAFYESGSKKGIQAKHARTLSLLLFQLANATCPDDMNTPGNNFHALRGNLQDHYAVSISGNWRITFQFAGQDAINVNLIDYH